MIKGRDYHNSYGTDGNRFLAFKKPTHKVFGVAPPIDYEQPKDVIRAINLEHNSKMLNVRLLDTFDSLDAFPSSTPKFTAD